MTKHQERNLHRPIDRRHRANRSCQTTSRGCIYLQLLMNVLVWGLPQRFPPSQAIELQILWAYHSPISRGNCDVCDVWREKMFEIKFHKKSLFYSQGLKKINVTNVCFSRWNRVNPLQAARYEQALDHSLVFQIFPLLVLLIRIEHVTGRTSSNWRLWVHAAVQDVAIWLGVVVVERIKCHRKQAVVSVATRNWTF